MKGIQTRWKEVKESLFAHNMTVYVENSKDPSREVINPAKIAGL
jgi:hypothetical protein